MKKYWTTIRDYLLIISSSLIQAVSLRLFFIPANRIDRKTSNADVEKFLNPFLNQSKDVEIVTLNSSFRNTFFVNRFNSHFGFDYSYQQTKNKSLLVSGSEERSQLLANSLQAVFF